MHDFCHAEGLSRGGFVALNPVQLQWVRRGTPPRSPARPLTVCDLMTGGADRRRPGGEEGPHGARRDASEVSTRPSVHHGVQIRNRALVKTPLSLVTWRGVLTCLNFILQGGRRSKTSRTCVPSCTASVTASTAGRGPMKTR